MTIERLMEFAALPGPERAEKVPEYFAVGDGGGKATQLLAKNLIQISQHPEVDEDVRVALIDVGVWCMKKRASMRAGVTLFRYLDSLGNLLARMNLGCAIVRGDGCKKDIDFGLDLLHEVAASSSEWATDAHLQIAEVWWTVNVPRRPEIGQRHYEIAARLGDDRGAFGAGWYYDRHVYPSDPERAAEFYGLAVKLGSTEAQTNLALLHVSGQLKESDAEKGKALLRNSIEDGDSAAVVAWNRLFPPTAAHKGQGAVQ